MMSVLVGVPSDGQPATLPEPLAAQLEVWEREAPEQVTVELPSLRSNVPEEAAAAAKRLERLGPESRGAIAALLDAWHWTWPRKNDRLYIMQQRRRRDDMRHAVRNALIAIGPDAVAPVAAAADDTNAESLGAVLEHMGSPKSIEPLTATLDSLSSRVRKSAVVALGQAGSRAVPALATALRDSEPAIRRTAASALAEMGEPAAVAALVVEGRRQHGGPEEARTAIARVDDPQAAPVLVAAINDRNQHVAAAAVRALGSVGDRAAVEAVIPLLLSEHANVYAAARDTLDILDPAWPTSDVVREIAPALVAALESPDGAARRRSIHVMRRARHPVFIDPLLGVLSADDGRTAAAAARALADLGEARAVEPTIMAIERAQEAAPRDAMVEALGRLGGKEALATLLAMSRPGQAAKAPSRRAAIGALAHFDESQAVARLLAVVAAGPDSGYGFPEVMTSLDALDSIRISDSDQQEAAKELLFEVAAGGHWLDQQSTRAAGQVARKAEKILRGGVGAD